jgi:hypothetical protein
LHGLAIMKSFSALSLGVALLAATGCYSTQEGRTKAGVPWAKDTIESRYERPVDQLFAAAKDTLSFNGTLTGENTIAKTLVASIDNRTVWVKVDEVEHGVSRVYVQARKSGGRPDIYLASELDKQIALRLR